MSAQTTIGLAAPWGYGRVQPELAVDLTAPSASGFDIEIGTQYYERPIALTFKLATSATAATREVTLQLLDPSGVPVAAMPVGSTQAASLTFTYSFQAQLSNASPVASLVVISPLFNWTLPSSYTMVVGISNVQVADQITDIRYYRDRFSTDPADYTIGGVAVSDVEQTLARAEAIIG